MGGFNNIVERTRHVLTATENIIVNFSVQKFREHMKKPGQTAVGVALILLSGVCFFTMISVPLMPLSVSSKAVLATSLFIGMQITWWSGAAVIGPSAMKAIWNKWKKKKN